MKKVIFAFLLVIAFSCRNSLREAQHMHKASFSQEEKTLLKVARKIIKNAYFGTLITLDKKGHPRARVMEPFEPDENFEIWLATQPKSRKVIQIKNNATATLHYFDKMNMGYVSLMGNAYLVNDNAVKHEKWKKGWERFYKNRDEDYMLIRFVPETLELISIPDGFTGDSITWKPHSVSFR